MDKKDIFAVLVVGYELFTIKIAFRLGEKLPRILLHFSLLLITSKNRQEDLVKSEEVIVKK